MNPTANRPGLHALAGRIGTHAVFLEEMQARLSSADFPELRALATRAPGDPALALLDAWATIADVLAFYQERIANEGYLRTATERRSVLELARLIGYAPRPGVAASAHLAYTLETDRSVTPPASIQARIPAGARAQSIPGQGELPQSFETSDPLEARTDWNNLQPRLTRPQTPETIRDSMRIFLKGVSTNLKAGDPVLIDFADANQAPAPMRVVEVIADAPANRTEVRLRLWQTAAQAIAAVGKVAAEFTKTRPSGAPEAVLKFLTELQTFAADAGEIASKPDDLASFERAFGEALEMLAEEHAKAQQSGNQILEKWLAEADGKLARTGVDFLPENAAARRLAGSSLIQPETVLKRLKAAPSIAPSSAGVLRREAKSSLKATGDLLPRLLASFQADAGATLFPALRHAEVTAPPALKFYALRVTAPLFGHNATPKPLTFFSESGTIRDTGEWPVIEKASTDPIRARHEHEFVNVINLAGSFDKIRPGSLLVVETAETPLTAPALRIFRARQPNAALSRAEYGVSGKITRIELANFSGGGAGRWIDVKLEGVIPSEEDIEALRQTLVHAQGEELELAEAPIPGPVCDGKDEPIELGTRYDGLEAGRWVIIAGERADIVGTSGVPAAELAMIAGVTQSFDRTLRGDVQHTFLTLATKLAYCYRRASVTIYGNVVKATHGETRREVLGSGDSAKAMQTFDLRQPPLTFISASDPSGIRSTLRVRVNDVEWHEVAALAGLGPKDRVFLTQIDDDGKTRIVFGNGVSGARPATGAANIRADYRNGIGRGGNVRARQIALLTSRPPGVKEVINPLRASGGADRESRDQARRNAPLAVLALDRLVSVQDYADFARTFAGIGKAAAARVPLDPQRRVHLTIAGADDIPIETHSDLFVNLKAALREFGDPALPVQIAVRELLALFLSASVRVLPDYEWASVEPTVRAALLEAFSFERRELGQGVSPGEVITVIQRVRGVEYVDLDALRSLSEAEIAAVVAASLDKDQDPKDSKSLVPDGPPERVRAELARLNPAVPPEPRILPAQLAFLLPTVPDTLLLTEITA